MICYPAAVLRRISMLALSCLMLLTVYGASAQGVSTGPELNKSTTRSSYFLGVANDSSTFVSRIKITGIARKADGSLAVKVLALDSEGNFVPLQNAASRLSTKVACRNQSAITFTADLESNSSSPKMSGSSAYVAIDNSMLAGTLTRDVILGLKGAFRATPTADSLGVGTFNQNLTTLQRVGPIQRTLENISSDDFQRPQGISALYACIIAAARELETGNGTKSLIIVTTAGDNASAVWNSRDVARYLRDNNIAAHIIRVGYDMASHPLRYICSATGGCLYTVEEENVGTIGDIIREILYAQRWNSIVSVQPGIEEVADCDSPWLRVELSGDSLQQPIADSALLVPRELQIATSPAIVALFDDQTDNGLQQYYPLLLSIAERLTEDINMKIELVGHVGSDVKENADWRALERAENVKNFLIVNGVLDKQIITRGEGNRKPRYYFQDDGTRRQLNNRVEAILIASEQRPYTVIVDQVSNEDEATKQRSTWIGRDFQVYYEPVLDNGQVAYRIVLWGFQSKGLAEAAASKIKKQFKPRYTIVE